MTRRPGGDGRRNGTGPKPAAAARRIYVVVGAPGAGKGTQAQRLSAALGLPHIASGDLFRAALEADTPIGREARTYMTRGALVPDDITVRMIADRLSQPDAEAGAILDGFPRTVPQAGALDTLLSRGGSSVTAALYIDVSQDEIVRRLSGRWICGAPEQHVYHETMNPPRKRGVCDVDGTRLHQRPDDQPKTIRARLEKQLPPMYEVIDHYADRGVLVAVPGERSVEEVTRALLAAVDHAAPQPVS
jgi:adenylate kinase